MIYNKYDFDNATTDLEIMGNAIHSLAKVSNALHDTMYDDCSDAVKLIEDAVAEICAKIKSVDGAIQEYVVPHDGLMPRR